jgi:L-seryl-tRNA(Ser) seleniumtransferase
MATRMAEAVPGAVVVLGVTEVGGGSAPGAGVPTWRCGIPGPKANLTAQLLRMGQPSILGRIEAGVVWLDPRTMEEEEVVATVNRLRSLQR